MLFNIKTTISRSRNATTALDATVDLREGYNPFIDEKDSGPPIAHCLTIGLCINAARIRQQEFEKLRSYHSLVGRRFDKAVSRLKSLYNTSDWILTKGSALLQLEGHDASAVRDPLSFPSYFVYDLLLRFTHVERVDCIIHICGLHTSPNDTVPGPFGLVQRLVAELVERATHESSGSDGLAIFDQATNRVLDQRDLGAWCAVLTFLVGRRSQDRQVLIMIDGIDRFLTLQWEDDLRVVMECLTGLTQQEQSKGVKVLITAADRVRDTVEFADDGALRHARPRSICARLRNVQRKMDRKE